MRFHLLLIALFWLWFGGAALAAQGSTCMPTAGTVSGLQFSQDVTTGLAALISSNSGNSAPTNTCAGTPVAGQVWLDTSGSPYLLKIYDGTAWQVEGAVDSATGRWTPPLGGGSASIASATTTDLWSVQQSYISITGTTTITGFGGSSGVLGTFKVVSFAAATQLTYNATSMILPTGASITTAAGDKAVVVNLGSGNAAVVAYTRADGSSLAGGTLSAAVTFSGIITPTALTGSNNNWAPTGLSTAAIIRAQATSSATVTGLTAQSSGRLIVLQNIDTATTITLTNEDSNSTAANRFSFGVNLVVGPKASAFLRYDGTLSRWVSAAGPLPASSSQATAGTDTTTFMTPANVYAQGQANIATSPQALAGTDNTVFMTPSRVAAYVQQGYRFTGYQAFTSSGTYTPTSGTRYIVAMCIGAGGAGGSTTSGTNNSGSGGGGQGTTTYYLGTVSGAQTVTIGSGGTAVANSTGNTGGATSIGSLCTAPGGLGGVGGNGGGVMGGFAGGAGGAAGTGTLSFVGQGGNGGAGYGASNDDGCNGGTGGGYGGGIGGATNVSPAGGAGAAGRGYGAGGGGACVTVGGGAYAGGVGAGGYALIEEYQ